MLIARVASMVSFAFLSVAAVAVQLQRSAEEIFRNFSFIQFENGQSLVFLHDPLSLFWLLFSSGVTSLFLFRDRSSSKPEESAEGLSCFLGLLLVSHFLFLSCDGLTQWLLLGLSNWLFVGLVLLNSKTRDPVRAQILVSLTVADLFWMLGLLGIYFITGTFQIPFLTEPGAFEGLSELATALMTTSVLSLMVALVIRLGMFPLMTWSNDCLKSELRTVSLLIFPVSLGGFLLFRWQAVLTVFPEPRTLLIGLAGLSAVLLPLSGLFFTGRSRMIRMMSVPVSFVAIGLAAESQLWPQMAALFAGTVILTVTLLLTEDQAPSPLRVGMKWGMVVILLCGTTGVEAVLQSLRVIGENSSIHVPPVMLPLMVLSLGLFVFGVRNVLAPRPEEMGEHSSEERTLVLAVGCLMLVCVSFIPFFISPEFSSPFSSFRFLAPMITVPVVVSGIFISMKLHKQTQSATPELGSLVRLCQNDYYLETILERGIVIPLEIVASLIHLFDKFMLRGLMSLLPSWGQREVSETSKLIEEDNSPSLQVGYMLLATAVLVAVVFMGS
ncbi:hypothetical protein [Thalassoglobus polymorphus]|uniref:hypothetical protein n=1 Tax=Thalassoglobus polymorphus TaxID=2527994 RepID=UPI00119EB833|nr:hypothetical protein [Thalassoglobus polymorphus]